MSELKDLFNSLNILQEKLEDFRIMESEYKKLQTNFAKSDNSDKENSIETESDRENTDDRIEDEEEIKLPNFNELGNDEIRYKSRKT